ncbi:uncharacterized protein METZ01_LOCUS308068, partial [marine metagenome]
MLRFFKSILYLTLMLFVYNCGTKVSNTKIPVSTKSAVADNLLQEAMQLNSISKWHEAKEKLLKAIEIDENFGFAYMVLSTFGTNTVTETDTYYEKALSLKD